MGDFAGDFHEDTADDGTAPRPVEYRITATAAPFSQEDWGIKIVCHLGASANPEQRNEFQSSPESFGRHTVQKRGLGVHLSCVSYSSVCSAGKEACLAESASHRRLDGETNDVPGPRCSELLLAGSQRLDQH